MGTPLPEAFRDAVEAFLCGRRDSRAVGENDAHHLSPSVGGLSQIHSASSGASRSACAIISSWLAHSSAISLTFASFAMSSALCGSPT